MAEGKIISKGWRVGRSILTELQLILFWGLFSDQSRFHVASVRHFLEDIPPAWIDELDEILAPRRGADLPLEFLAFLVGTLVSDNYGEASLLLRDLTLERGVALVEAKLLPDHRQPAGLSLEERWVEGGLKLLSRVHDEVGYDEAEPGLLEHRLRGALQLALPILSGGAQHSRFWHWLDRFYYDRYQRWRVEQEGIMLAQEQHAIKQLGTAEGEGKPSLSWLPPINPLRHRKALRQAVEEERVGVLWWVQPFELADSITILPGQVVLSFAQPGEGYQSFLAFSEDVAHRLKALSDPTRLLILRMIRAFSMDNTEMASFLELARPTVSVHAKILREAGLIRTEHVGRQAQHEIDAAALRALFRDLESLLDLPTDE